MPFRLLFSSTAETQFHELEKASAPKFRKVRKCLALLEANPRHPGLNSHRYAAYDLLFNEKIWESYVENRTPGAYRIFWGYGPGKDEITIYAIIPHP